MKKKTLYLTTVTTIILSEEEIPDMYPCDIIRYADEYANHCQQDFVTIRRNVQLVGKNAVRMCEKHGIEPDNLLMDDDGFDTTPHHEFFDIEN